MIRAFVLPADLIGVVKMPMLLKYAKPSYFLINWQGLVFVPLYSHLCFAECPCAI